MERKDLAQKIYFTSHITGEFLLRSGKISNEYFDKYLFESDPNLLSEISSQLIPLLPKGTEFLAGLEMGGIPLATAISLKNRMPALFVRKKAKEYGTRKLAEGTNFTGRNLCIA